ncbi:MAG TPA: DUF2254 domain-containing protein [Chthoniobacteraceae bacterium]|jgi:uncharacterized membrane protein
MKARLITFWEGLHTSFWFVPTVMVLGAILLSAFTLHLDENIDERTVNTLPFVFRDGVEGARSLLATVAGSMITVTGVTFSVVIVAFTLASSQFSPRLLRNFMRDVGNQVVLGTFIAGFSYCLFVLRVVGGPGGDFVPRISVTVGFALTIVSVGALVYFVHHASALIQAQSIIADVGRELDRSLAVLYPDDIGTAAAESDAQLPTDFAVRSAKVSVEESDYIEAIDGAGLLSVAETNDLIISLDCRPGGFIGPNEVVARVYPAERASEAVLATVREVFIFAPQRTQTQDEEFALFELVEIAVRALSAAINDPHTACLCVDRLGAALAKVAARPAPSAFRCGRDGKLRVVAKHYGFRGLADAAFNQIRQYGANSVAVTIRLLEAIRIVAHNAVRDEDRRTLLCHARMVERASRRAIPEPLDQEDVQEQFQRVLAALHVAPDLEEDISPVARQPAR